MSSSASIPSTSGANHGVPIVRATAPGDEFRDAARAKASIPQKPQVSQKKGTATDSVAAVSPSRKTSVSGIRSGVGAIGSKSQSSTPLRRFHISTSAADAAGPDESKLLHKVSGGVQKKKGSKPAASRVVVVEKRPHPSSKPKVASSLEDLTTKIGDVTVSSDVKESVSAESEDGVPSLESKDLKSPPRKGHVINEAEKRWREETRATRYADRARLDRSRDSKKRTGQSVLDNPNLWDQNSEQLASELEQVALEMTGEIEPMDTAPNTSPERKPYYKRGYGRSASVSPSKPALKYQPHQPRTQIRRRSSGRGRNRSSSLQYDGAQDSDGSAAEPVTTATVADSGSRSEKAVEGANEVPIEDETDANDGSFVYDEFIRRPVNEILADPKAREMFSQEWLNAEMAPRDIGVVVITEQDVHYWDALAESDEEGKGWDSEDEDSNGEIFFFKSLLLFVFLEQC